jgi:hypothetical protein
MRPLFMNFLSHPLTSFLLGLVVLLSTLNLSSFRVRNQVSRYGKAVGKFKFLYALICTIYKVGTR